MQYFIFVFAGKFLIRIKLKAVPFPTNYPNQLSLCFLLFLPSETVLLAVNSMLTVESRPDCGNPVGNTDPSKYLLFENRNDFDEYNRGKAINDQLELIPDTECPFNHVPQIPAGQWMALQNLKCLDRNCNNSHRFERHICVRLGKITRRVSECHYATDLCKHGVYSEFICTNHCFHPSTTLLLQFT